MHERKASMKKEFLALVEEVKATGIAERLYATSSAWELAVVGQNFFAENLELFKKIKDWASEFKSSDEGAIFGEGETIKNPMEIAIVIRIINDAELVSECELFEDADDLGNAIRDIGNDFATAVADYALDWKISGITDIEIFAYYPKKDSVED